MTDALEIANLKARYCAASDAAPHDLEGSAAGLRACFVANATADYGFMQFDDPDKLIAFMGNAIGGGAQWMVHMLGSPNVEVNGDGATGDWTIAVQSRRKDGETMQIVGRYSDRFVRTADGWRISHIKFDRYE